MELTVPRLSRPNPGCDCLQRSAALLEVMALSEVFLDFPLASHACQTPGVVWPTESGLMSRLFAQHQALIPDISDLRSVLENEEETKQSDTL